MKTAKASRSNKSQLALSALVATALMGLLSSCSPARWHEVASHTGDAMAEKKTTPNNPTQRGQTGYVVTDRLRARTNPDQPGAEAPYLLERNDKVIIVDPAPQGKDGLIKVIVVETSSLLKPTGPVYVPPQYIGTEPAQVTAEEVDADRYFMIQNIATEKVRVYERCQGRDCAHKLILETDMTAGENTPDRTRRTMLGSYRITQWFKFYEDNEHAFPSWYNPKYPPLPGPGADIMQWVSRSLLPDAIGSIRGSFGWYTAKIGPDAGAQWTHGTLGWGADGAKFILLTRDVLANYYADPRSHGCTRVENQAIAFMREILPAGTKLIKVYAKEAVRDPSLGRYQGNPIAKWDWILTKDGVDVDGSKSGRAGQLMRGVTPDQILEQGTYIIDQHPDPVPFRPGVNGHINENGNLYDLPESAFQGYLIVDEGRLVNYRHPKGLRIGGHSDMILPSIMISSDANVIVPHAKSKDEILKGDQDRKPNENKLPDGTVINQKPSKQKSEKPQQTAHTPSSRQTNEDDIVPDPSAELIQRGIY